MYHQDNPISVYCPECWWADDWDGTEYEMDYDPNRPFFEQLQELIKRTPWVATETLGPSMVNSEYCNGASWLRNCYLTFWADYCENIANSSIIFQMKDSSDVMRARESQLCYESNGIHKCYNTYFSELCRESVDLWFCRNCYNCTNCVGCVNLRGESYCIFNKKYSKEEYIEKIKEMGLDSWSKIEMLKKQSMDFWMAQPWREYTGSSLNVNATGEYMYECKNSRDLYLCEGVEDSRYCQFVTVETAKDCYDYSGWGSTVELIYEAHSTGEKASNIKFSYSCYPDSLNIEYSIWASGAKNCFGCVNLKRKSYCILNKEYSKEEYEKLKSQIIEDMKKNPYVDQQGRIWSYGEFYPITMYLFGYNESDAMKFFPKTKEEALKDGYTWYDEKPTEYKITKEAKDLPETIMETPDSIVDEIIACVECERGYKVSLLELTLLKKMGLPVPHSCQKCRLKYRFSRLNPIKLWQRNCAKCQKEITTAFAPERPEIVYCEKCYQQEFN